jgi:AraC-like DNA-binding protein
MSFQLASTGRVSQGGRSVPVPSGSLTVYATDAPYEQDYSRDGQRQLIVQISRRSMGLPGRMVDQACQRMSVPALAAARVFHAFVARLVEAGSDDPAAAGVTAADLASSMLQSSLSSGPVMPRTGQALLETVRDHVRRNFTAPELTVDSLAAQHSISRRRLYQLFDDVGESPAEWIRTHRLEYAAGLLGDSGSRSARLGAGEVAQMSGFSDAATFARAFRRKYGMNPSEFRASRMSAA